jgi:hypothetical protein
MKSTKTGSCGSWVALGAPLILAVLTLAGCSTPNPSPMLAPPTPTSQNTSSTYTIEETTEGFIYKDAPSGYAITFPQRPDVEPLANNQTDQPANFVSIALASSQFVSIGQVLDREPNLRAQLMGFVQSLNPSGQVSASSYMLGGLDAAHAQFTTGDSRALPSSLVGQPGEVVVAGDGNRFYELVAIGGTSDQRQAFFDSFERIDD